MYASTDTQDNHSEEVWLRQERGWQARSQTNESALPEIIVGCNFLEEHLAAACGARVNALRLHAEYV